MHIYTAKSTVFGAKMIVFCLIFLNTIFVSLLLYVLLISKLIILAKTVNLAILMCTCNYEFSNEEYQTHQGFKLHKNFRNVIASLCHCSLWCCSLLVYFLNFFPVFGASLCTSHRYWDDICQLHFPMTFVVSVKSSVLLLQICWIIVDSTP